MKWYKKLGIALAGGICAVGISTTWATYQETAIIHNVLSTKQTGILLAEDFSQFSTFLPGETIEKEPYFVNTGQRDMLLRVPKDFSREWSDGSGNLLAEKVVIDWSDFWREDWFLSGNYYYYKKKLQPGAKTPPIMEFLKLSEEISNDGHDGADYSGKEFNLTIEAEAIPADAVSVHTAWGEDLSESDLEDIDNCNWKDLLSE